MAYAFNDDKSKFDLDTLAGNMATIEVSPVINNHGTGEYILYDNVLYEVISPIATGESLVLGTNVKSINIGDQLKTLQDSVGKIGTSSKISYLGFSQISAGHYLTIKPYGTNGNYSIVFQNANIVVYDDSTGAELHRLNWDS